MSNTVAKNISANAGAARHQSGNLYVAGGGRKYLNLAERQRALAVIATLDIDKALFALTLAWTGARVSEVLALTPASFQTERGIISFVTLKRRRLSVREVPIPGGLMEALNDRFRLNVVQLDSVASADRLWKWRRETAWRIIKLVMQKCGVVGRPACPRGFRHGFGVGALHAGVPINLVQRWLGHARISTTAIYADACGPEELSFAARFWETK